MNRRVARIVATVAVLLALQGLVFVMYRRVEGQRAARPEVPFRFERLEQRRPAPELELERPDGSVVRLSELRGRWVLVHFWATWCPPCREELPGLLELDRTGLSGVELELLAIAVDEPWEPIRHFFGGEPPVRILRDRSGTGHRHYGVSTLPASFLVTPEGQVAARFDGARDWRGEAARRYLEQETKARE